MSILIKGMKMPKTCDDCFLPLQYCPYAMKPNGKCPLIPVPPHGRLIDADALKTMWDNEVARLLEKGTEYLDYHVDTLFSDFKHDVDKMATIIQAEEIE